MERNSASEVGILLTTMSQFSKLVTTPLELPLNESTFIRKAELILSKPPGEDSKYVLTGVGDRWRMLEIIS